VQRSLFDLRGNQIDYYAWGFVNVFNNMVEAYSLWKGLDIKKEEGLKTLIILGDSMLVMRAMVGNSEPGRNALTILILRIHKILESFDEVTLFHIKRELNGIVDQWVKVASYLSLGSCIKSGVCGLTPIP
jgi:ribonuclease HI